GAGGGARVARGGAFRGQGGEGGRIERGAGRRGAPAARGSRPGRPGSQAPPRARSVSFLSGLTERFRQTLARTREAVQEGLDRVLKGEELQPATIEDLEEILIQAHLGVGAAQAFVA